MTLPFYSKDTPERNEKLYMKFIIVKLILVKIEYSGISFDHYKEGNTDIGYNIDAP